MTLGTGTHIVRVVWLEPPLSQAPLDPGPGVPLHDRVKKEPPADLRRGFFVKHMTPVKQSEKVRRSKATKKAWRSRKRMEAARAAYLNRKKPKPRSGA